MTSAKKPFPLFFFLLISIVASSSLSACRFGNRVETNDDTSSPPQSNGDWSGTYDLKVNKMSSCVALTDGSDPACAESNSVDVPDFLARVFTNPVQLAALNLSTGESQFQNYPGRSRALPIQVNLNDYSMKFSGATDPIVSYFDDTCQFHIEVSEKGAVSPSQKKLLLAVQTFVRFESPCNTALKAAYECFTSHTCGGATDEEKQMRLDEANLYFQPLVPTGLTQLDFTKTVSVIAYQLNFNF